MGGMFSKPKSPKLPAPVEVEDPQAIVEDEESVKRRKRASSANQGRTENILSGIGTALKKRLGE